MLKNIVLVGSSLLLMNTAFASLQAAETTVQTNRVEAPKKKRQPVMPIFIRSASNEMAPMIHVHVNGSLVNFASGEPVEADGRIMVPMRGVFEALGATVGFDTNTQTIHAVRGDTTIRLRVGDESAEVNGEARPLDTPVLVLDGTAVVPLRFVSEALGAQVKWDPNKYDVNVNTEALTALQLPTATATDTILGMLTGVYPEAKLLTVRLAGGQNVRVPLTYDVSATRRTIGTGLPISFASESKPVFDAGALKIGEQVQIELNDKAEGTLVLVSTDLRRGEIKAIDALPTNGGNQVTLTDGSVIMLASDALILFENRPVPISAIKPSEKVVIRLNERGEGASLAVITPIAPNLIPRLPDNTAKPATPTSPDATSARDKVSPSRQ